MYHVPGYLELEWEGIPQRGNVTEVFKTTVVSLCHETTIQSVSRAYNIPYTTLERWYYEWADREIARITSEKEQPKIISIDDFAIQKGHQYALSIVDYKNAQICQVTRGRSGKSIKKALKKWPYEKPDLVVVDLAPAYLNTIKEAWPGTKLAADPFLVIQLFTKELDKLRKRLLKNEKSQGKRRQATRLLTTRPLNLNLKELLQLEEWLSQDKKLEELYQALQGLRRIYVKWHAVYTKCAFKSWVNRFMFSSNEEVRRIAKTLLQWEDAILNAIKYGVSNGRMEGLNTKLKMIKRRGFGYRNLTHFERRLQMETGYKTG